MTGSTVAVDVAALRRWERAVMAAFGLGGITISAWGPRLPAIKEELGISAATIGVLLASVTIGALAGLVVSTPLLHWLGSRRGMTTALLVIAAIMTVMGVAITMRSVPLVGVAFVVVGFGIGILDILINVEGSAIERAAGRTRMPRMHAAWSIGAAVGAGIGAACAALAITPSTQFIGEAVMIGAVALLVAPAIPDGNRTPDEPPSKTRVEKVRQWLRGWLDWRLLLIGVVMFGVELGEGGANNWLTLAVHNEHGQTAAVAALFFTAFAISEALARIFGGPVVDRVGRAHTIRYTTALGVLGVVLFILGTSTWTVFIGVLFWAVGVSMGFPLGMSAAAESGPGPAARVSVVASIGYFANLAGPPAIGFLAESAGLLNALWLIAALMLVAFALAGSFRRQPAPTVEAPTGTDLL
jgi:MFS family permease